MTKQILGLFIFWRLLLFLTAVFAIAIIPNFGDRFPYYDTELLSTGLPPWLISFGNFDGVHYLRAARTGYESEFSQAFFPLFPLMIKLFLINNSYYLTGLILANLLFLAALFLFYKLINLDYDKSIALKSVIVLLAFPTSFYFGSVYSESLFLFLVLASLYSLRKKNYLLAGLFAGLSTATRIFGLFLLPVFLIELYLHFKQKKIDLNNEELVKVIISLLLIPLGIGFYMLYLKIYFNDPFYFLNAQPYFGAERTQSIVLLPQVLYRYLKMLLAVPVFSLPFLNAFLEIIFTLIPLAGLLYVFKKIRFSYWIFMLGCLTLPTLTGTLSSMPRYALMSFLLIPLLVIRMKNNLSFLIVSFVILAVILLSLFSRGYWIA